MENFNRQLRNIIVNNIEYIANYLYVPLDTAILFYTQILYEILELNNDYSKLQKTLVYQLIYADAYKVNNYINKKLLIPRNELLTYNDIVSIIDYDDLNATISADPNFFANLLKASYIFHQANGLTKVIMTKSLSNYDNEKIKSISPLHDLDLKQYDKKITLEDILKNYKNQDKLYKNELDLNFEQARIEEIYGFIKELSSLDINNTKDIIKKIAIIDNKISLYLKDKVVDDEIIDEHINTYNNGNYMNELLYNKDFLMDAIWMVIDSCINHNYNDIIIDDNLTNDILKHKRN